MINEKKLKRQLLNNIYKSKYVRQISNIKKSIIDKFPLVEYNYLESDGRLENCLAIRRIFK